MKYPRVLIIYHSCINKADPNTVSLRNWFADWPKDSLAQIYSGNEVGDQRFCGHTFRLGPDERRLGRVFFRLKGSSLGEPSQARKLSQDKTAPGMRKGVLAKVVYRAGLILVKSGLWELMFRPVISPRMARWIQDFKPDVIYAQGYLLSFAWLTVSLQRRFGLPVCYHAVDDWPSFLYKESVVSSYVRPHVDKAARTLLQSSSVRFAIGDRMADEYHSRYGLDIEPLMICDSLKRFKATNPHRLVGDDCVSVVYAGGLGHHRWKSIVDLSAAAELLGKEGVKVTIFAFTAFIPPDASDVLTRLANVRFEPLPSHEELPGILKGGDILFLPETFDPHEAEVIRSSVSTKAPLYMLSERPILVYGSPVAGVVDYAKKSGWGYVVEKQEVELLARAINKLQSDRGLSRRLVKRALEVAKQNHETAVVRERLRLGLQRIAATRGALQPNT